MLIKDHLPCDIQYLILKRIKNRLNRRIFGKLLFDSHKDKQYWISLDYSPHYLLAAPVCLHVKIYDEDNGYIEVYYPVGQLKYRCIDRVYICHIKLYKELIKRIDENEISFDYDGHWTRISIDETLFHFLEH